MDCAGFYPFPYPLSEILAKIFTGGAGFIALIQTVRMDLYVSFLRGMFREDIEEVEWKGGYEKKMYREL